MVQAVVHFVENIITLFMEDILKRWAKIGKMTMLTAQAGLPHSKMLLLTLYGRLLLVSLNGMTRTGIMLPLFMCKCRDHGLMAHRALHPVQLIDIHLPIKGVLVVVIVEIIVMK